MPEGFISADVDRETGDLFSSFAGDWPRWRGPFHNGSADEKALPDSLTNPLWASDLPGASGATPIICADRVFVSSMDSGDKGSFLAMCFDAKTGKELWRKPIGKDKRRFPRNNMATPSPVTDGKRVFSSSAAATLRRWITKAKSPGPAIYKKSMPICL